MNQYKYLTTEEMQALEKHAVENYPITLEQMMRSAGKAIFDVVMDEIMPIGPILVIGGRGNNGGDALVAAHMLKDVDIDVTYMSPYPADEYSPAARKELDRIWENDIPVGNFDNKFTLIIDGLFGFSLSGDPKPPTDKIIEQINCSKTSVLSVDVPSGMDVHNGSICSPIVEADYTVALGMLKNGFWGNRKYTGKLYIGDLGIPEQAYRDLEYEPPMFKGKSYIFVN